VAVEPMTKQMALREKLAERFDALPPAWFENELFEQTRDYLTRGRRFEKMRSDQIDQEWAKAFRQYVRLHVGPHVCNMADAWAELRLRGAELPTHLVTSEMEQLQGTIKWIGPIAPSAEFDRNFDEFIKNINEPISWGVDPKGFRS
jgi:hypothetical protein